MAVEGKLRNFTCLWAGVKPTDEELEQILADHEVWLDTSYDPAFQRPEGDPPHDLKSRIIFP
jgi:hypothetical protein